MSFTYGNDRKLVDHGAKITRLKLAVKIAQEELYILSQIYGNTRQIDNAINRLNEVLEDKKHYERK